MEQRQNQNLLSNNTDNKNRGQPHSQSHDYRMTKDNRTSASIFYNRSNRANNKKNKKYRKNKKNMKRFDPIALLPFDMASKVFSHLDQRECLKIMGVSKLWMERVPLLTTAAWRTIELLGCFNDVKNIFTIHRMLGPHVNKLIFGHFHHEEELFDMMHIAYKHSCTQQTELWIGASQVINQEVFLKSLRPLVKNVTKLEFTQHDHNLAFLHIMAMCPKLQSFSFKTLDYNEPRDMYSQDPKFDSYQDMFPSDDILFTNMTYLYLGATLHKYLRLTPILVRCPNLRCLRVGSFEGIGGGAPYYLEEERHSLITTGRYLDGLCHRDRHSTDINLIFKLCPKLQYLELNNSDTDNAEWDNYYNLTRPDSLSSSFSKMSLMQTANFSLSILAPPTSELLQRLNSVATTTTTSNSDNDGNDGNREDPKGLKLLYVHELFDYGPNEIVPEIKAHQNTLEQLELDILMSGLTNSFQGWAKLSEIHSESLREFACREINCSGHAIASLIRQCPKLEAVEISGTGENIHSCIITEISKLTFLKSLSLHYAWPDMMPRFIMDGAVYGLLRKFIRQGAASTITSISTNAVDDTVLELLTFIPTLNSIRLVNCFDRISSYKQQLKFISCLCQRLSDIYNLELSMFDLTPAIFDQIAGLPELMFVNFCGSSMTKKGLEDFLDKVTPKLLLVQTTGLNGEVQAMTLYDKFGNRKKYVIMDGDDDFPLQ